MGMCPPQNYQQIQAAMQNADQTGDYRIDKMEMLVLFKRLQRI